MESDGTSAFQAPLGLLHAFGGWADKFGGTGSPITGIEDAYASAAYKVHDTDSHLDGTKLMLSYHDFRPKSGGGNYGTEVDAAIVKKFAEHYTVAVHYANYNADGFGADTQKVWLTLGANF